MSKTNINILESLPDQRSKAAFMAGGKVTVQVSWQMEDEASTFPRRYYVAKIRGVSVGDETRKRFETPEQARDFGKELLAYWRKQAQEPTP